MYSRSIKPKKEVKNRYLNLVAAVEAGLPGAQCGIEAEAQNNVGEITLLYSIYTTHIMPETLY